MMMASFVELCREVKSSSSVSESRKNDFEINGREDDNYLFRATEASRCGLSKRTMRIAFVRWFTCFLLCATSSCFGGQSSTVFSGNWRFNYLCDGSPGADSICAGRSGDFFVLYDMTQRGDKICGYHIATGHSQAQVDEGDLDGLGASIYGSVTGSVAHITFRSTRTGKVGEARLRRAKDSLIWDVVIEPKGESLFPPHAVLHRVPDNEKYPTNDCFAEEK